MPTTIKLSSSQANIAPALTWSSSSSGVYEVLYKNNLTDPSWTLAQTINGTGSALTWTDTNTTQRQRFYVIKQLQ